VKNVSLVLGQLSGESPHNTELLMGQAISCLNPELNFPVFALSLSLSLSPLLHVLISWLVTALLFAPFFA
jgi:hypothetical protein